MAASCTTHNLPTPTTAHKEPCKKEKEKKKAYLFMRNTGEFAGRLGHQQKKEKAEGATVLGRRTCDRGERKGE